MALALLAEPPGMFGLRGAMLIVDSSPAGVEIVSELRNAGFVIVQAAEFDCAREYLRHLRFDLVLVDLDEDLAGARGLLNEVARSQPNALCLTTAKNRTAGLGLPIIHKPFSLGVMLQYASWQPVAMT